jgi:hypothetical protein
LSANADKRHKLIRKLKVTTASEQDTNHFEDVIAMSNAANKNTAHAGNDRPGTAVPPRPARKSKPDQKWYSAFTIGVLADAPGTRLPSLPNFLCQYW